MEDSILASSEKALTDSTILDAAEKYFDAPIGLQLVGKRFHDEEVVAIAKVIEKITKG